MLKRTMLLAAALVALPAFALPAAAGADARAFTKNGKALTAVETVTVDGFANYSGELGGVGCNTKATVDLGLSVAGGFNASTGTVTSFDVLGSTADCVYFGGLDALCGSVDSHVSTGLPWTIHGTAFTNGMGEVDFYGIRVTNLHVKIGGTGIFCPDVTVRGEVVLAGNAHLGNNFALSGTLESNLGVMMTAEGVQSVTAKTKVGEEEVEDVYGLVT